MSKLLKLKEWVSVPAAAKHISIMVGEEVTAADVLRLGLDGHLRLSSNLVNGATAKLWQVIDREEVAWETCPSLDGTREIQLPIGGPVWVHSDGRVFQLKPGLTELEPGVWDLPLIGPEVHDVEREHQRLTGGPEYTMQSLEGPLVSSKDGAIWQLMAHFQDNPYFDQKKLKAPYSHPDNFYPASALPEDSVLVVRTSALAEFQFKLSGADDKPNKADAALHPRAEATYLTIIGALLELALGKSEAGRPHSIFTSQAAIIDALIAHNPNAPGISKTTLEAKFADAKRRLHST